MPTPLLTGDVARMCDVSSETVRLWERTGILPAVRTESGVRLFSREDVERLVAERAKRTRKASRCGP